MNKRILWVLLAAVLAVICICSICLLSCNNDAPTENKYLLKFKSDGTNYEVIVVGSTSDSAVTLPQEPKKAGYSFAGWYYDDGSWKQPFDPTKKITADTDVYAKWTVSTFTISYELNGGAYVGESNPDEYSVDSDDIVLLPLVRDGYAFDGWFANGNYVERIKKGTTGNLTLSAKWVKGGYTISYTNTKGVENNNPRTYTFGDTATPLADLEKIGYSFDGWYIGDTKYTEIPANTTGNLTLEGRWSLVNYTISYVDPTGTTLDIEGFDLPTSYTIESATIVLNAYYLDGYNFEGWHDADGIQVTAIKKGSHGNIVLYAALEPLSVVQINYNDPFGRPNDNPIYAEYGETLQLLPLKKIDYDFVGWSLNGMDVIESVEVYPNMTLFALWEQKKELADFDYIVDDGYVGYGQEGFVMLLDVIDPAVTELTVPGCVSMVRSGLLRRCTSLQSLTLPFIGESSEASAASSYLSFLFGGSSYEDNATLVPKSLKTLIVEGGSVADYALFGCERLEKLVFSDDVTRIGDSAVGNCTSLKELQAPFIGEKYCEDDDYNGISNRFPDNARPVYIFGGMYKEDQFPKALEKLTITKGYAPEPTYYFDREKATRFYSISRLKNLKEFDYTSVNDYLYDYMFEHMASIEKLTIRGDVKKLGQFFGLGLNCNKYIREANIPDTVTELGDKAFYLFDSLATLSIPNVKKIGAQAFMSCPRLSSVELCNELTSIGDEAFSGCSSLFSITIPKTVTEIGTDAFKDCANLFEVYNLSSLPAEKGSDDLGGLCKNAWEVYTCGTAVSKFQNIDGCVVYDKDGEKLLMKYIGEAAEVDIPDGVTVIYAKAFADCNSITSVTMPETVKIVRDNAFDACSNLVSVKMTDSITSVGKGIFANCKSLTNVRLPSSMEAITERMFENCTKLAGIELPSNVKTICVRAFAGSGITELNFGNVVTVEEAAFEKTKFVQLTLGDKLTTIADNAFNGCPELTTIAFGAKLEKIGKSAFADCSKLIEVVLPDSLTLLDEKAFYQCGALTSAVIGSNVTVINSFAFGLCGALTEVTLHDNIVNIEYEAFFKCKISDLQWPSKLENIGGYAFGYNRLKKVVLPDSVKNVGDLAFAYNDELTELVISEHTETMGSGIATCAYALEKLAVPFVGRVADLLGDVGEPYKLTTLVIHGGSLTRTGTSLSEDGSTFGYPRNNVTYFQNLTSLTLGKGVTSIADGAIFNLPALRTLILPSATYSTELKKLIGQNTSSFEVLGFSSGDVSAEYISGISAGKWVLSPDVTNPGILPAGSQVLYLGNFEQWNALSFANKNSYNVYYYSQDQKLGNQSWRYTFNGIASPEIW